MPRIKMIEPELADSALSEIYDQLIKSRGKLANVHKIHSLNPESLVAHMDLYMAVMFGKSPLKRYQREMMAVVVSRANDCLYCQKHHGEALAFYWKDKRVVRRFTRDYTSVSLDEVDLALCAYARLLTLEPGSRFMDRAVRRLTDNGLSDRAVLDATLVISYFNFVNRIVMGLEVEPERNAGGYNY